MANQLQETLDRIIAKSNVLVERYHLLSEQKEALATENEALRAEVTKLRALTEQLQQDNKYLLTARSIAPNKVMVDDARATISRLVRDIDRCIMQLNE